MSEKNYTVSGGACLALPAEHADKLLALGEGSCALLYLYALRTSGGFSLKTAAVELRRTETELNKAAALLESRGLLSLGSTIKLPLPAEELPEYTAADIATRCSEGGDFPAIIEETQRILGKTLTSADMKTLFGIYDHLKIPAEVIFLLIHHCLEFTCEKSGAGRLPSMKTIEKEAYVWFNREIITYDSAEEYLRARRHIEGELAEIKRVLQIQGRKLTPTERQYAEDWLEMGFDADAVEIAYDRTVVQTGTLHWRYMHSILTSWDKKNLHTADEIRVGDGKGKASPTAARPATGTWDNSDLLKKILDKNGNK